jgi:adenylate cyclase
MNTRKLATVLFTDIVGSTERLAGLGDSRWSELLERHRRIVRERLERFGGREVTTTGDGFLALFDEPGPAIRCATAIRDAGRSLEIEIRSGIHAGEIERTDDDDVGGIAVHLAARVMGAAESGEILVTGTVRELVQGGGFRFEARGVRELAGVPGRWALFAVAGDEVRAAGESRRAWASPRRVLAIGLAALVLAIAGGVLLERDSGSSSDAVQAEAEVAGDPAEERGIAVLPLENLSPAPEDAYLAGAMTEEITSALSKVPGLRVVSRTSASKFAGSGASAREIAEQLGVRYLLEGSARRAGEQVAIVVQLIDARTDEHVWTQRYERSMENTLGLQVEIAESIAEELRSSFTERERQRIRAGMTDDPIAYDLFLRSIENSGFFVREETEKEIELLEEAVTRDPGFALAWFRLGVNYRWAATYRGPTWADSSRAAFDRAVDLVAEPTRKATFGAYRAWLTGEDPAEAIAAIRAALPANPGDPLLVQPLAFLEYVHGDLVESARWYLRARALDPVNAEIWAFLGGIYFRLGLQQRADEAQARALEIDPVNSQAWIERVFLRLEQGRYAEAFAVLDSMNARGANPWEGIVIGVVHLWAGDLDRARAAFDSGFGERPWEEAADWTPYLVRVRFLSGDSTRAWEIVRRAEESLGSFPRMHDGAYLLLSLAAARGDAELATERLREYIELGGRGGAGFLRKDPVMAPVLSDPEFQAVLDTLAQRTEEDRRRVERLIE